MSERKQRGRPAIGRGYSEYIPQELIPLVIALKSGNKEHALKLFTEWMAKPNKSEIK